VTDCLHFCSTPRNVFFSIGQACRQPELKHHLVMIDQPYGKDMPIVRAVEYHKGPFKSVSQYRKGSGLLGKRRIRQQVFKELDAMMRKRNVTQVFTGNDRRIEFQYVMHQLRRRAEHVKAIYLEDGVNSYLPYHPSHRGLRAMADPALEPLLKRLSYGDWYDCSGAVGCSRWIDTRRLTMPQLLQTTGGPEVEALAPEAYTSDTAINYLSLLTERMLASNRSCQSDMQAILQAGFSADLLLVLPHSNDLLSEYGSAQAFYTQLKSLLESTSSVWVKYHPNETMPILEQRVQELPRSLPMEMLMSQCHFNRIVGDTSAALLSAKWLHPAAEIISVNAGKKANDPLFSLMGQAGIKLVNAFAEAI